MATWCLIVTRSYLLACGYTHPHLPAFVGITPRGGGLALDNFRQARAYLAREAPRRFDVWVGGGEDRDGLRDFLALELTQQPAELVVHRRIPWHMLLEYWWLRAQLAVANGVYWLLFGDKR